MNEVIKENHSLFATLYSHNSVVLYWAICGDRVNLPNLPICPCFSAWREELVLPVTS